MIFNLSKFVLSSIANPTPYNWKAKRILLNSFLAGAKVENKPEADPLISQKYIRAKIYSSQAPLIASLVGTIPIYQKKDGAIDHSHRQETPQCTFHSDSLCSEKLRHPLLAPSENIRKPLVQVYRRVVPHRSPATLYIPRI